MTTSQVLPDLLTYNSMISAFVSGAQWELALSTLREAGRGKGRFLPDVVSCLANMGSFHLATPWRNGALALGYIYVWRVFFGKSSVSTSMSDFVKCLVYGIWLLLEDGHCHTSCHDMP